MVTLRSKNSYGQNTDQPPHTEEPNTEEPITDHGEPRGQLYKISALMIVLIFLGCYGKASVKSTDTVSTGYYTKTKVAYQNNQAINCPDELDNWQPGYHDCFTESNQPIQVYLQEVDFIVTSDADRTGLEAAVYWMTSQLVSIAGTQMLCPKSEDMRCIIVVGSVVDEVPQKYEHEVFAPLPKTYPEIVVNAVLFLVGLGGLRYMPWP